MANPNNAIGTNGAFGGRTSPNAFNDILGVFVGRGILSGWEVAPNSGMSVVLGGSGTTRDVAIAEDNAGNKLTVNNISRAPIVLALESAPATGSRIDAIVVYIDNPPRGSAAATDNYEACHILDVIGVSSNSPTAPNDSDIRTAITADGASGATAYYVVLGYITITSGTTDITSNLIKQGDIAVISEKSRVIEDGTITSDKLDWNTLPGPELIYSEDGDGSADTQDLSLNIPFSSLVYSGTTPKYSRIVIEVGVRGTGSGISWMGLVPKDSSNSALNVLQCGYEQNSERRNNLNRQGTELCSAGYGDTSSTGYKVELNLGNSGAHQVVGKAWGYGGNLNSGIKAQDLLIRVQSAGNNIANITGASTFTSATGEYTVRMWGYK